MCCFRKSQNGLPNKKVLLQKNRQRCTAWGITCPSVTCPRECPVLVRGHPFPRWWGTQSWLRDTSVLWYLPGRDLGLVTGDLTSVTGPRVPSWRGYNTDWSQVTFIRRYPGDWSQVPSYRGTPVTVPRSLPGEALQWLVPGCFLGYPMTGPRSLPEPLQEGTWDQSLEWLPSKGPGTSLWSTSPARDLGPVTRVLLCSVELLQLSSISLNPNVNQPNNLDSRISLCNCLCLLMNNEPWI